MAARKRGKRGTKPKPKKSKLQKPLKDTPPTAPRQSPEQPPQNQSRLSRLVTSIWFYFVALATVFGLIGGYILFVPRLSVSTSTALDVDNPFSTSFAVSNDGHFSLYSIRYECNLNKVEDGSGIDWSQINLNNFFFSSR
jgi:hypothetical protein